MKFHITTFLAAFAIAVAVTALVHLAAAVASG